MKNRRDCPGAFGERIKQIRRRLALKQDEFGKSIGHSGSFVSEVETGKTKVCFDFISNLVNTHNVNPYFFFFGEGDLFSDNLNTQLESSEFGDSIEHVNELAWYFERSPLLRHAILAFVTKFVYENENKLKKEVEKFESRRH